MAEFHKNTKDAAKVLRDTPLDDPVFQRRAEEYEHQMHQIKRDQNSFREAAQIRRADKTPDDPDHTTLEDYLSTGREVSILRGSALIKVVVYLNKPSLVDESTLSSELSDLYDKEAELESLGQQVQDILDLETAPPNMAPRLKILKMDVTSEDIANNNEYNVKAEVENATNTEATGGEVIVRTDAGTVSGRINGPVGVEGRAEVDLTVPATSEGKQRFKLETKADNGLRMSAQRTHKVTSDPLTTGEDRTRQTGTGGTPGSVTTSKEKSRVVLNGTIEAPDSNRKPIVKSASIDSNDDMDVTMTTEKTNETGTGETTNIDYEAVIDTPSGVPGKTPGEIRVNHS